ncbi:uncharacterized protein LOC135199987 isoform X2 [Macrobrachium nipponense]|uniref:uncharacterized protein LOC135199987 isoform X2 n=1 Tax=Macrobrachium nipponense TaxID=159736 RepID=UPI0030C871BB
MYSLPEWPSLDAHLIIFDISDCLYLFSPCIKTILQTRKSPQDYLPGTSNRRAVIRALTDDLVKKHIVTLSKQGYTNLVNALFSEYPHIGDPKCWRMSLRTKMKNIRMPLELNNVQFLKKKKKFGCLGTGGRKRVAETVDEEREACKKRQKLKIDLDGPGDDEVTTLSHIDILMADIRGSPDLAMIARKMERTCAFRWKKINDPNLSVEDILLDFPALRKRNFISAHGLLCSFCRHFKENEEYLLVHSHEDINLQLQSSPFKEENTSFTLMAALSFLGKTPSLQML